MTLLSCVILSLCRRGTWRPCWGYCVISECTSFRQSHSTAMSIKSSSHIYSHPGSSEAGRGGL